MSWGVDGAPPEVRAALLSAFQLAVARCHATVAYHDYLAGLVVLRATSAERERVASTRTMSHDEAWGHCVDSLVFLVQARDCALHSYRDRDDAMCAALAARSSACVVPADRRPAAGEPREGRDVVEGTDRWRPLDGDEVAEEVVTSGLCDRLTAQAVVALREEVGRVVDADMDRRGYPLPGRFWLITWWR